MAIYIVVPLTSITDHLNRAVEKLPHEDCFQLQPDRGWLIKYSGTSIELSNSLGITVQSEAAPASVGPALIVPVYNYFGLGPGEMWEWLATRFEQKSDAL